MNDECKMMNDELMKGMRDNRRLAIEIGKRQAGLSYLQM
jgi:hypothetical protein